MIKDDRFLTSGPPKALSSCETVKCAYGMQTSRTCFQDILLLYSFTHMHAHTRMYVCTHIHTHTHTHTHIHIPEIWEVKKGLRSNTENSVSYQNESVNGIS